MFKIQYLKKLKNDLKKLHLTNIQNLENIKSFLATIPNTDLLECQDLAHQLWLIFIPKGPVKLHTAI